MIMKSFIVVLAVAGGYALGACAPARAGSVLVEQRAVHYQLSELSSQEGIKHIYRRLNEAAGVVCGDYSSSDLLHGAPYQRCVAESVTRAVAQIHDERLSRYHESQTNPVSGPIVVSSSAAVTGG
jgi:UrcA family protein